MASFGPAHIARESTSFFFLRLRFCEQGGRQKAGPVKRISAGGLNRGAPFMAVYEHPSSKTHIQITSSSPNGSSDTRMMAGRRRGGGGELESRGASLPFSYVPVD